MALLFDHCRALYRRASIFGGALLFHTVAVALIFALTLWLGLGTVRLELLLHLLSLPDFRAMSLPPLLAHLALAVVLWTFVYALWALITSRTTTPRHLARPLGTVVTETLIVMPVFLLLVFGLGQLILNSIAGVVTTLASQQASRAVWLWHPELARFDSTSGAYIDDAAIKERARIQAAAVLTPVASSYGASISTETSQEFAKLQGALLASQLPISATDAGLIGMNYAAPTSQAGRLHYQDGNVLSFAQALGVETYATRSVLKLSGAYLTTEVDFELTTEDGQPVIKTLLTYHHHQAFPLVGYIFGEFKTIADRQGYYSTFTREFTIIRQIDAHRGYPHG